ncbi:MAG: 8-oxo-dGTP diphosphatase MutT, partial [bacterium]
IENPIDRSDTQSRLKTLLEDALSETATPGKLSEALMELGALVCTPSDPECGACPLAENCSAYELGVQQRIPVTGESSEKPHHEIAVGVVRDEGDILISRRPEDAMLGGLWEFPGGKQEDGESIQEALRRELKEELGVTVQVEEKIDTVPHQYSHLSINLHAYWCTIESGSPSSREGQKWRWVPPGNLDEYAFPKANKTILEQVLESDHTTLNTTGNEIT